MAGAVCKLCGNPVSLHEWVWEDGKGKEYKDNRLVARKVNVKWVCPA